MNNQCIEFDAHVTAGGSMTLNIDSNTSLKGLANGRRRADAETDGVPFKFLS